MRPISVDHARRRLHVWAAVVAATVAVAGSGCGARCDRDALAMAARSIDASAEQWTAAGGHVADDSADAIAAVWAACPGLPDEAKAQLDLLIDHQGPWVAAGEPLPADADAFLEPRIPGHGRLHGTRPTPSATGWSGRACADYDAALRAAAGSEDRAGTLYDACDLQRFGVVTREELTTMQGDPSLVGFALYRELLEDGVAPEVARSLARAVILSDRDAVAALAAVSLPMAQHGERSRWIGGVTWSPHSIVYADRRVVQLEDDGSVEPAALEDGAIEPLRDLLASEHDMLRRHGDDGDVLAVPFAIDRSARWRDVAPGLSSAAAAGWTEARLLVLATDRVAPLRELALSFATRDPMISVAVGEAGTTVRCAGDEPIALGDRPPCLATGASVVLDVRPEVRWQAVIDALDDLRGRGVAVHLPTP